MPSFLFRLVRRPAFYAVQTGLRSIDDEKEESGEEYRIAEKREGDRNCSVGLKQVRTYPKRSSTRFGIKARTGLGHMIGI